MICTSSEAVINQNLTFNFKPIRLRDDKENPNHISVFNNIISNHIKPISLKSLKGENDDFLYLNLYALVLKYVIRKKFNFTKLIFYSKELIIIDRILKKLLEDIYEKYILSLEKENFNLLESYDPLIKNKFKNISMTYDTVETLNKVINYSLMIVFIDNLNNFKNFYNNIMKINHQSKNVIYITKIKPEIIKEITNKITFNNIFEVSDFIFELPINYYSILENTEYYFFTLK